MVKFEVMRQQDRIIFLGLKRDKNNRMSLTGIFRSKHIWKPYYASIELI